MFEFLKNILKPKEPVQPAPPIVPAKPEKPSFTSFLIREAIKYSNLRESHGRNRSPELDKINLRQGSYLGAPWCLALMQQVLDDVRASYGCIIHLPKGVGTQNFWSSVSDQYRTHIPRPGMIGILRHRNDKAHGHAFLVVGVMGDDGWFQTFEGNTNLAGDREGEGAFFYKRHINGSASMELLGFVDVEKAMTPA